jgi:hypothetical protein
MKTRRFINGCFGALTALVLTACVTASKEEHVAAEFGTLPASHEGDIKNFMSRRLKDPHSAVYTFHPARKGIGQDGLLRGAKRYYGYIVPVDINAKNSYGGYAGTQKFYFFFMPTLGRFSECTSELGQMVKFVD